MDALRPRIAIVVGELPQPRFLALFEPLREAFDCVVHALHHERLVDLHGTGLKLRIYEAIQDMPGYMRGLEDELAGVNLIIGVESSRLSTFQAVRAARKHGIPFSVVVNEFHPFFYERFANIRAIQFDIINKAERFWATSAAAEATLRLDNVPAESIARLAPAIDVGRFQPSPAGRERFRKYVGLAPDDIVAIFHHDLEPWNRPAEALRAWALLRQQIGPKAKSLRLMFCGTGAATMDLKYLSYDLGLGPQVLFLHQNPEPFLVDLYAAADLTIMPRARMTEFHEEIPLRMLEAMACGAVAVVGAGSLAAELAGEVGVIFGGDGPEPLAAQLSVLVRDRAALAERQRQTAVLVRARHSAGVVGEFFLHEVSMVLATALRAGGRTLHPSEVLAKVREELARGAGRDALLRAEEGLLLDMPGLVDRAELLRLKGDAHYSLGEIEAAMTCYGDGLKVDERNFHCLRGLGFVAWQGHSNEDALTFFRKALALRDDDAETMLGIGLVYRRLGLTEEAIFWLERCAVSFGLPAALVALAQICAQLSRPRSGIEVLGRVIDAVGENHTLMMTLGQLYLADGRVAEGHAILEKALGGAPTEGTGAA